MKEVKINLTEQIAIWIAHWPPVAKALIFIFFNYYKSQSKLWTLEYVKMKCSSVYLHKLVLKNTQFY